MIPHIRKLLDEATPGPWRTNTREHAGDDWMIGILGYSDSHRQDLILTTDGIRASSMNASEPDDDGALIVALRNRADVLIRAAEWVMENGQHEEFCKSIVWAYGQPIGGDHSKCDCGLTALRSELEGSDAE